MCAIQTYLNCTVKELKLSINRRSVSMLSHNNYQVSGAHPTKPDPSEAALDGAPHLYRTSFRLQGEETYQWSDTPTSLSEIVKQEPFPLVVKLCTESVVKGPGQPVDLHQPLLLYKSVKTKRLHARNLRTSAAVRDANRIIYQIAGPYITFPETFYGFFKEIESRDEPLSAVADIGRLMPASFLSTQETEGYSCVSCLSEATLYQKTSIAAGLYRPSTILEDTITYCNKRKSEKKKLVRCLQCEDERGKRVLLPLESKGRFYVAEPSAKFAKHRNVDSGCRIYRWTEMDRARLGNLRVRMLHGRRPQQECHFTGFVEFRQVTEEHTLVGATMSANPRLFEMSVSSEPFFIVAKNSKDLSSGPLQQKCIKFAKAECGRYLAAIKVRKDLDIDNSNDHD